MSLVVTNSSAGALPIVDDLTGAGFVEEAEIFHTHEGKVFSFDTRLTVGAGATGYIQFLTGANVCHLRQYVLSCTAAPLYLTLFEGATTSAAGSSIPIVAMNRTSTIVSTVTATSGPTVTLVGTQLADTLIPGNKQDGGFGNTAPKEFMFLTSTKYLFRIVNPGTGSTDTILRVYWIEP